MIADGAESNPMEDVVLSTSQASLSGQRRSTAANAAWSEEDKSMSSDASHYSDFNQREDLFLHLLSQYGDDFKRIAASMPNKVRLIAFSLDISRGSMTSFRPRSKLEPSIGRMQTKWVWIE